MEKKTIEDVKVAAENLQELVEQCYKDNKGQFEMKNGELRFGNEQTNVSLFPKFNVRLNGTVCVQAMVRVGGYATVVWFRNGEEIVRSANGLRIQELEKELAELKGEK